MKTELINLANTHPYCATGIALATLIGAALIVMHAIDTVADVGRAAIDHGYAVALQNGEVTVGPQKFVSATN